MSSSGVQTPRSQREIAVWSTPSVCPNWVWLNEDAKRTLLISVGQVLEMALALLRCPKMPSYLWLQARRSNANESGTQCSGATHSKQDPSRTKALHLLLPNNKLPRWAPLFPQMTAHVTIDIAPEAVDLAPAFGDENEVVVG